MRFKCTICHRFASPHLQGVLQHIGSVHSFEPGFKVTCGISGCSRTYGNFRSFQKHIRRRHVAVLDESETNAEYDPGCDLEELEVSSSLVSDDNEQGHSSTLKRSDALFLLKTKEIGRVSQVTLDSIVGDLTELFQARVTKLKEDVQSVLQHSSSLQETVTAINMAFNKEDILKPFAGLESEYLQKKYFEKEMNMLVCLAYTLHSL